MYIGKSNFAMNVPYIHGFPASYWYCGPLFFGRNHTIIATVTATSAARVMVFLQKCGSL